MISQQFWVHEPHLLKKSYTKHKTSASSLSQQVSVHYNSVPVKDEGWLLR